MPPRLRSVREESGERVAVIDTDMQKSAMTWKQARTGATPALVTLAPTQLSEVIAAARHDAMTLCIVDNAPHAAPDAARVTTMADLIVIPCRPTAFDLAAAGAAVGIVRAASAKAAFILSACPFRAPENAETRLVLQRFNLPVAPVAITDPRAFTRAVATDRAVTEFDSEGKAAEEIRALWVWIKEQLDYGIKADRVSSVHPKKRILA